MRINVHVPYQARNAPAASRAYQIGRFYEQLSQFLDGRCDIDVTYSKKRKRPKHANGAYCINYHSKIFTSGNINIKSAYLPGFVYVDCKGYSGWSEITERAFRTEDISYREAEAFYRERIWDPLMKHGKSKFRQPGQAVEDLPSSYVFVPLQVPTDSVMRLGYFSQEALILECMAIAKDIPIVLKIHPLTRKLDPHYTRLIENLHNPSAGFYVVDGHIHRLIENAHAVVCTNSGAGIEALLLGRPVITCGKADYHHITTVVAQRDRLKSAIESVKAPRSRKFKKFAYWFFGQQLVDQTGPSDTWGCEVLNRLQASAFSEEQH